MIRKSVKYTDFNGVERTEDFYFHITKTEALGLSGDKDLMARLNRITESAKSQQPNMLEILSEFRSLVELGAGMRSEDGARFIKTADAKSYLMDSPAYDELLFELCSDATAAAEFFNGMLPADIKDQIAKTAEAQGIDLGLPDARPAWEIENREPTKDELMEMSKDELVKVMSRKTT